MPVGTPFTKGASGNPAGRPVGSLSLDQRIRRILEGDDKLPDAIAETIRAAVGADRQALEAVIIVGLLQALQGDKAWAQLLFERGYGKLAEKIEGGDIPIQHVFTLKIDNS